MRKTVLIADDDYLTREVLEFVISSDGHRVLCCEDGREVLSCLKKETISLILMDILMPKLNGIETLLQIRKIEHADRIPVVLMTGVYKKDEIQQQMSQKGIKENILYKPLSLDVIQSLINRHLGETGDFHFVFPNSLKSKPGFERRVNITKLKMDEDQATANYRWYVPHSGDFSKVKFLQLLHYIYVNTGRWYLNIKGQDFESCIEINDDFIKSYWINKPDLMMEDPLSARLMKLGKSILHSDRSHPFWDSSTKYSGFMSMLHSLITLNRGQFQLSHDIQDEIRTRLKRIPDLPISKIIVESVKGPFTVDTIRSTFPLTTSYFQTAEHCKRGLPKVDSEEIQQFIIENFSNEKLLGEVVSKWPKDATDFLTHVYGLWLLGVIEFRAKNVRSSTTETRLPVMQAKSQGVITESHDVSSKSDEFEDNLDTLLDFSANAQYFAMLGLTIDAEDSQIIEALKKFKRTINEFKAKSGLSDETLLKIKALDFSLHEASLALIKAKIKNRYLEIIKEKDPVKRGKMSEIQIDRGSLSMGEQVNYRSILEYKLAIMLNPRNREAYLQLLQSMTVYPECNALVFRIASRAIKLFKDNTEFHLILGRYFMDVQEPAKALEEFRRVLSADPENIEALQYLLQFPDEKKNLGFDIE